MMRPRRSSSWNTSHVAHRPTRFALAISTRGASAWVVNTPTGFPDCTSRVSSSPRVVRVRQMRSNDAQSRAALPVPPYTTRSCGRSATSGSRVFMSMRSAASWIQPLQVRAGPRDARTLLADVTFRAPAGKRGTWNAERGTDERGRSTPEASSYVPRSAFHVPRSFCSAFRVRRSLHLRIELPVPDPRRDPFDVGAERAVAGERRDLAPHRGVRPGDAAARRERLQEL